MNVGMCAMTYQSPMKRGRSTFVTVRNAGLAGAVLQAASISARPPIISTARIRFITFRGYDRVLGGCMQLTKRISIVVLSCCGTLTGAYSVAQQADVRSLAWLAGC